MLLAQENERASVSGYITDSETGETLISANIALLEINKGMASNTLGYYSLTNVQPGTYTLVCNRKTCNWTKLPCVHGPKKKSRKTLAANRLKRR